MQGFCVLLEKMDLRQYVASMNPDPSTIAGVGMAILGSKDLINKLLGPTAEYFGQGLKNLAERSSVNLNRIIAIAIKKAGDRLTFPGQVNPRVLKRVIEEGAFCEDEVVTEYIAGILASSRTADGTDDRGVCFLNEIQSMSSQQLRTHYLLYSAITNAGAAEATSTNSWVPTAGYREITLEFTDDSYLSAMQCTTAAQKTLIGRHTFLGLQVKQLSEMGIEAYERTSDSSVEPWRFCWPTRYGHELFAWGIGLGDLQLESYFDIKSEVIPNILPPLKTIKLENLHIYRTGDVRSYHDQI